MWKYRLWALVILLLGGLLGWYVYHSQVTYKADLNAIAGGDVNESMNALRDTIERRVNIFGVAEPLVQTEKGGTLAGEPQQRLIVELPGGTDTEKAIAMIGQTPTLEFRMLKDGATVPEEGQPIADIDALFEPAAVTGKKVERAELQFGNGGGLANEATVVLHFNSEGKQIFADLTGKNVGKIFGIFLDGVPISTPVIREAIPDGTAV